MKTWKVAIVLAALSLLLAVAMAAAQQPVRGFDQLDTRLKPGDTIWVTDMQGREVKGKVASIDAGAIRLRGDTPRAIGAADTAIVRHRRPDSLLSGTLIGFGVGAGLGLGFGNFSGQWQWSDAAVGALMIGSLGAGIGVGIDALIPGKKQVVYRAPGPGGAPHARLSIAPVVTRGSKGLAVSFAF